MLFAGAAGRLLRTADAGQQRQQLGGKAKHGGGQQPAQAKIIQRQGLHQRQLHTAGVQGAQHAGQQCAQRGAPADKVVDLGYDEGDANKHQRGGYTISSTGAATATIRSRPRLDTTALNTQMTVTNTL